MSQASLFSAPPLADHGPRAMLLSTRGIGVPDWPKPFGHAVDLTHISRAVADHLHEYPDRVMWRLLFDDLRHLEIVDSVSRGNGDGPFQTTPAPSPQGTLAL